MKIILTILCLSVFTGLGLVNTNELTKPEADPKVPAIMLDSAEDVVREYISLSHSCKPEKISDLTVELPSDRVVRLSKGDKTVLNKDIRTPDGPISRADIIRKHYLEFVNSEFPQTVCRNRYAFGTVMDVLFEDSGVELTVNFEKPDGTLGFAWTFLLTNTKEGWRIYDIEPPAPFNTDDKSNR